jgi:hypothetical protein
MLLLLLFFSQGDGEPSAASVAAKQLVHFDHSFKSELHTTNGMAFTGPFGPASFAKRTITLTLKANTLDIMEDVLSSRKFAEVSYAEVSQSAYQSHLLAIQCHHDIFPCGNTLLR